MSLSTFQYMILAGTSYFNQEYLTDRNPDGSFDTSNDNEDRIENFLASINDDDTSSTFGAVTSLLGVPGWQEFVFNQKLYNNDLPDTDETFDYQIHAANILKTNPEYAGYSFDRSGLDAKIFVESNDPPAVGEKVEVVIAFAGTDKGYNDVVGISGKIYKDLIVDIDLSDGDVVDQAYAAIYYVQQAKQALDSKYGAGNYEISFTGHSLGGHLASVAAAYFGNQPPFTGEAHIFNSAPQTQAMLDVIQELTAPPLEEYVVDDLGSVFPALPAVNADPESISIYDYHLTNDALRTMSRVDTATADDIAFVLEAVAKTVFSASDDIQINYPAISGLVGANYYLNLINEPTNDLNFESFDSADYFSNTFSQTVDLGASVPYEYLEQSVSDSWFSVAWDIITKTPSLQAKVALAIVNLHLGGQLLFMLSNKEDFSKGDTTVDFGTITNDDKLPWFWVEAFNSEVTGFESALFQHPDTNAPYGFFLELVRIRFDALANAGTEEKLFDNFIKQIDILANANLDNLLLTDGSVDDSSAYNVFETVVQHAIMQHTRNQIEDFSYTVTDVVTVADDVLTVDLTLLDKNFIGEQETYQVENLLWERVYARSLVNNENIIYNEALILEGSEDYLSVPAVEFIESGETQKLYLDGSDNSGVNIIMDQGSVEQSIVFTGAGADVIEGNSGRNLIFAGAGSDEIISGVGNYNDLIYAGLGNDTIKGSEGFDFIHGSEALPDGVSGTDIDTVDYSLLDVGVYVGPTVEYGLVAKKGGDTGIKGVDILESIERFILTDRDDVLYGYDGLLSSDAVIDARGNTVSGRDVLDFSLMTSGVTVQLNAGTGAFITGFEEVVGSDHADFIYGDSSSNWLFGGGDVDRIYGMDGDDHIVGGSGSDILDGGLGNDTYYYSQSSEFPLYQNSGTDFISDIGGDDTIFLSGGYKFDVADYSLIGGALDISGVGYVEYANDIEHIIYSDSSEFDLNRLIGDDWLYGAVGEDLTGGIGNDYLFGSGVLDGGAGDDYLSGEGEDGVTYLMSSGADIISDFGADGNLIALALDEDDNPVDAPYTLWKADNGSLVIDFESGLTSEAVFASQQKVIVLDHFGDGELEYINGVSIDMSALRIFSTQTDDELIGTSEADVISGGAGDDIIDGGAGSDLLIDGDGDDIYTVGRGDRIVLGEGNNQIQFSSDAASAGDASVTYTIELPADVTYNDVFLYRDADENTYLDYGLYSSTIAATFNPILDFASDPDINLNKLVLTTFGTDEGDDLTDAIYGYLDSSNIFHLSGYQDDVFYLLDGDDDIVLSGGNDTVYGGAGNDNIGVIINPSNEVTPYGYIKFYGEEGNDILGIGDFNGELYGGAGNDELIGGAGVDILDGGDGDDWLFAEGGNDTVYGGDGNDFIVNLAGGAVTVDGGAGNDFIVFDNEMNDIVDGGDGLDIASFENQLSLFGASQINLATQTATIGLTQFYTFTGIEGAVGAQGDDTITGTDEDNYLDGGTSLIAQFAGNDTLIGEGGNDTYFFGREYLPTYIPPSQDNGTSLGAPIIGDDIVIDSSGGNDSIEFSDYFTLDDLTFTHVGDDLVISFAEGSVTIQGQFAGQHVENLVLSDGTVIDLDDYQNWVVGTDGGDTLSATASDQVLVGQDGIDTLNAFETGSILDGGAGDDILNGGIGDDTYIFNYGYGNNTITEGAGFDTIAIGSGISLSDISFSQIGNDLSIQIASGFLIKDFYVGDLNNVVEQLLFEDGSTFDLTSLIVTNAAPVAADDTVSGLQDGDITGNVLLDNGNGVDSDPDGDVLNVVAGTYATINGSVVLSTNGDFTYTPNAGYVGADSFEYILEDGNGGSDMGTVTLTVNSNADTFTGTSAAETFDGEAGSDTVDYSASLTAVSIDLENNIISGGDAEGDTLISIENIIGSDETTPRDYIWGDANDNTLEGRSGNDILEGGAGADTIDGGAGWDYSNYIRSDAGVSVNLATNINTGGHAEGDILIGIEAVVGSDYDDDLTGGSGNDYLKGGAGNDILDGADGFDNLYGEAGNDIFRYAGGTKIINETTGLDRVVFDATWVPENVVISDNFLSFIDAADNISFNDITLIEEFEFNNTGSSVVIDLATLQSYNPEITTIGDESDNVFYGTESAENFDGMDGIDTVDYSNSELGVTVDLEAGTGSSGDASGDTYNSIENVTGSDITNITGSNSGDYRDWIWGDANDNVIKGLAGNDILEGGAGADTIDGGDGWDYARYLRSDEGVTINLQTGANTGGHAEGDMIVNIEAIVGSNYNDFLTGGTSNDYLKGELGNDYLFGGVGADTLYGGAGTDTFAYDSYTSIGSSDHIRDFNLSEGDMLDIADLLSPAYSDPLTQALTDFVQITDDGTDSTLSVDIDGGGDNFVSIATLYGVTGITDEDALVTSGHLVTV